MFSDSGWRKWPPHTWVAAAVAADKGWSSSLGVWRRLIACYYRKPAYYEMLQRASDIFLGNSYEYDIQKRWCR
jgi:hypothetical protein